MKYYDKKDKKYLYQIIDLFISGEIDAKTFCDEYYYSYSLSIDYSNLTELETNLFFELDQVVSRFSEYPEDHKIDPKAFANQEELKKAIFKIKNSLKN